MNDKVFHAVGKRKTAVARVYMTSGQGKIKINDRELDSYFVRPTSRMQIMQPLELTGMTGKLDVNVNVYGSGMASQAGATRHGIARALLLLDAGFRPVLKKTGLLTRDSREVERKKYGQSGARKRYQFSKR